MCGSAVIVCLPALMRSGSTSLSRGNGPMPSMPFSRLQGDFHAVGNVVRHQRGNADAEIDIEPVAQFLRRALRHFIACPGHGAFSVDLKLLERRPFAR